MYLELQHADTFGKRGDGRIVAIVWDFYLSSIFFFKIFFTGIEQVEWLLYNIRPIIH